MAKANRENTTPNDPAPMSNKEAALIRACNRMTAAENASAAIFASPISDKEAEAATAAFDARSRRADMRIRRLGPPTTAAGATAIARAAVAFAPRAKGGEICRPSEDAHFRMALIAAEFFAIEPPMSANEKALIRACDQLWAAEEAMTAILNSPVSDEEAEVATAPLRAQSHRAIPHVRRLDPPATFAGCAAMARAIDAHAMKLPDGTFYGLFGGDLGYELAVSAIQALARATGAKRPTPEPERSVNYEAARLYILSQGCEYHSKVMEANAVSRLSDLAPRELERLAGLHSAALLKRSRRDAKIKSLDHGEGAPA